MVRNEKSYSKNTILFSYNQSQKVPDNKKGHGMSHTLSIVLSSYNGERFIKEQLDSLANQTRAADEVFIIDDCSTDNTVAVIQQYIEDNNLSSWKVAINEQNKGWRVNFMEGISAAAGSLIFPCDQDDIWYPDKLEKMEKAMDGNDQIGVLVSELDEFYPDNKVKKSKSGSTGDVIKIFEKSNFMKVEYPGCVYCVRKSFFSEIMPYWKPSFPHDAFLWRFAMFSGKLYVLKAVTIKQRKHRNSTFTKEAKQSKCLSSQLSAIDYAETMIAALEMYVKDKAYETQNIHRILNNARLWNERRRRFLNTGNFISWLSLAKYIGCYATPKKYLLDLYVVIKEKGKKH